MLYVIVLFLRFLENLVEYGCKTQFVIFKLLSYCFEETKGSDVKASFASRSESRLIR